MSGERVIFTTELTSALPQALAQYLKRHSVSAAAVLVGFSSFANATDWEVIERTPISKVYIDRSSVVAVIGNKKDPDSRAVMTLISYDTEQKNVKGRAFFSMSFVDTFTCANRTRTTLSSIQYEGRVGTGKVITSHKMGVLLTQKIMPGTLDELILGESNCNLLSGKW